MQKIAVLISGRGSNMLGIAECCRQERWPARIVAVISNRPGAAGLRAAADLGLATEAIDHTGFAERADFDAALAERLEALGVDWIVLAGFMRVLGDAFVTRFAGRIVNIHPSLLPAFPGLHTHRRALEAGVRLHGATVHLVTSSLDLGPIVAQAAV
ncbi:MAG: phosphoribosylglycinamide formyltransferase, partial [Burkholderiaceae bacterium]